MALTDDDFAVTLNLAQRLSLKSFLVPRLSAGTARHQLPPSQEPVAAMPLGDVAGTGFDFQASRQVRVARALLYRGSKVIPPSEPANSLART